MLVKFSDKLTWTDRRAELDHHGVLLKADSLHTIKCQEISNISVLKRSFISFKGQLIRKVVTTSWSSESPWAVTVHTLPCMLPAHPTTNLPPPPSKSQQAAGGTPEGSCSPRGCIGCYTALPGASLSSQGVKCSCETGKLFSYSLW